MSTDLLTSVMSVGGRCARYGDFVVVILQCMSFASSSQDYQIVQRWARARRSCGNATRDRASFVDRFETVLARQGSAIATRGNKPVLQRIVSGMKANGMQASEWQIPHNLYESMEVKKPAAVVPPQQGN